MSEFIIQIEKLLTAVGDAEYRYLLIEPLIFYGLLTGVIMLGVGFFMKAHQLQTAALIVVGVAALAHFPYKDARLAAQPRMEQVYKISSPSRVKGFAENTSGWIAASWQFRLLVLCAGATLMIGINRNRIGFGLAVATMLLGLLTAKNAMWLNYQDAVAYHPNLKVHEAPIDKRSVHDPPPPVDHREKERRPPALIAEPLTPAARVQPTPGPVERIPAPLPPPSSPRPRQVQPLSRY